MVTYKHTHSAQAVAMLIKIPRDRANLKLHFALRLLDPDGKQVTLRGIDGQLVPIGQEGDIEAGRPPGIAAGSMLDAALPISVPSMPLPPGRYEWRLELAEQTLVESFTVRSQ